jgi:hypothetical protein
MYYLNILFVLDCAYSNSNCVFTTATSYLYRCRELSIVLELLEVVEHVTTCTRVCNHSIFGNS